MKTGHKGGCNIKEVLYGDIKYVIVAKLYINAEN